LHAALHFRCAEFFMVPSDFRKEPLRKRLISMFREAAGVAESARREVACGDWRLPAWHFSSDASAGTMVVFGGFDSYIEEFFPIPASLRNRGWNVIGFEGPGQGSVLEEQHAPLTRDWHRPVAAVLDAFRLDDVTLVGISLGGCLAVRAAAFEPRVRRVAALAPAGSPGPAGSQRGRQPPATLLPAPNRLCNCRSSFSSEQSSNDETRRAHARWKTAGTAVKGARHERSSLH
jgi:alpha-beta hydrolase superfamily lysophospholipase